MLCINPQLLSLTKEDVATPPAASFDWPPLFTGADGSDPCPNLYWNSWAADLVQPDTDDTSSWFSYPSQMDTDFLCTSDDNGLPSDLLWLESDFSSSDSEDSSSSSYSSPSQSSSPSPHTASQDLPFPAFSPFSHEGQDGEAQFDGLSAMGFTFEGLQTDDFFLREGLFGGVEQLSPSYPASESTSPFYPSSESDSTLDDALRFFDCEDYNNLDCASTGAKNQEDLTLSFAPFPSTTSYPPVANNHEDDESADTASVPSFAPLSSATSYPPVANNHEDDESGDTASSSTPQLCRPTSKSIRSARVRTPYRPGRVQCWCGRWLSRANDIPRHLKTRAHGGERVKCKRCGDDISREDAMKRHRESQKCRAAHQAQKKRR
ncbi:hypothetical protein K438DRAFT_1932847 [Mycena galopus ATCC 62051]|nr:hypothetical protein K438DRAFT_1932847 [Mycena galopus ATCC 62051]